MRTPIIAGNWKMNMTPSESVAFAQALIPALTPYSNVERLVLPTFLSLVGVAEALQGSPIKVGSQQVHYEDKGAFTSQISPTMLKGIAEYVLVGHSECRQYLAETDETVNRKTHAVLKHGLKVIIAVGESHAQYQAGETRSFVSGQVRNALKDISTEQLANIVIAYEPIWAIGTGLTPTTTEVQDIIGGVIRSTLSELYGNDPAQTVRIQYGGSVTPDNMAQFMALPDVDGALVGGASLKVDSFTTLVRLAAEG